MKRFGAHDRNLRFDAETILRQPWSAEKLLLNAVYNVTIRGCGK